MLAFGVAFLVSVAADGGAAIIGAASDSAATGRSAGRRRDPQACGAPMSARPPAATCHAPIYERWSKTRMANVVRDPREHPDAIIPDLSKPDPLVTFKKDDIAFVYGSKWKQRYFTKVGDDYFPLGAQWDVANKVWRAVLRAAEHRLVGAVLSGRQHEAADRAALRRLPLGELRHPDQDGDRVERRLREVPRAGQRARPAARTRRPSSIRRGSTP